ncbi:type VII secretion-associated serine protease mycosin [Nocardia cyriacigeorgica]|uniref:type VII secretion-associated serine protease mycosin n=1 Tax=Nocardia cyriacigeorgica TaxID=135487 RepID=UPI002B4B04B3|nr:type VII secretion-associated serine protease mycosin [Nocardia cyriacigeorgica]
MNGRLRVTAAALTLGFSASFGLSLGQGVAYADRPPPIDMGKLPAGDPAVPPEPTEQKSNTPCASTQRGGDGPTIPGPQRALDLPHAWKFSRGAGQTIAVIDTGVTPHPRLPGLMPGGDYVAAGGDGLQDCDAHGTVVAGLIAASQVDGQGFSGVAPDARILSIRQTSSKFQKKGRSTEQRPEDPPDGYGNIDALASAVRRAADRGVSVINISLVLCVPGSHNPADSALGAALRYATVEKNVVVVAAAGNKDQTSKCGAGNPDIDPLDPTADLWENLSTNVTPARYDDYVLTVGSIGPDGQPSDFTVPGPWVDIAAPGEGIVSLDTLTDGTIVAKGDADKITTLQGTSFAAPYVSGVVALVRSRFPHLTAQEVIKRLQATAHAPAEGWNPFIGYGAVDPVAALTNEVPDTPLQAKQPSPAKSIQLPVPAPPPPPDHLARNVALIGTGIIGGTLVLGYLASFPIRRRFGVRED